MAEHTLARRDFLRTAGAVMAAGATGTLLSSCGSDEATAGSGNTSGDSDDLIKIGLLFSLSGNLSIAERAMHNGALLAIDEINQAGGVGGRQIQAVTEDYASDFSLVVEKARQLTNQNVTATVGCYSSASRKAVLPVFQQSDSALVYPTFYEGLECSSHVIYSSLVANQHLTDTTDWMIENLGKRIYMVGSDYVGPQTYNAIVQEFVERRGGEVIANRLFPLGQTEFGPAVSAIRSARPDAVWCTIVGDGIPAFYKQCRSAGLTPEETPIVSGITTEQELVAMGPEAAEGHFFPSSYFQTIEGDDNQSFVQRYQDTFGADQPANLLVQASYTSVKLIAAAIEKAGEETPSAVLRAFPGVSVEAPGEGTVTVQDNHHTTHQIYLGRANADALYEVIETFPEREPDPFPEAIVESSRIPDCPRNES